MKKKWKQMMAICCSVAILMTMPGMCVLADEMPAEEIIFSEAEGVEDIIEYEEESVEEIVEIEEPSENEELIEAEAIDSQEIDAEVVGAGNITVGDNVTATFDSSTGAVKFYSNNGTLWRDWLDKSGINALGIKSIQIASGTVYLPKDSSDIFCICGSDSNNELASNLKTIDFRGFNTSNVTNMNCMFWGCRSLVNLDLSSFDTAKVTGMNGMFFECDSLSSINMSSFTTSNVTNMSYMFYRCKSLKEIDLSRFDTSKVTDMSYMFNDCESIENLNLKSFNTSLVKNMEWMFTGCNRLTKLDVSSFNTSRVTNMDSMFASLYLVTELNLNNFNTANVTNMGSMFSWCKSLTNLDLSSFDLSNVSDIENVFTSCNNLKKILTPKKNSLANILLPITMYDSTGKQYSNLPTLSKSIILTSTYQASYTVTFNANGGSVSTTSKTVTNGGTYGTLPTPTRSNYKFDGWYTSASGGTKVTSSTTVNLTGNQTLYAHWTYSPASYTITFNANGGSVSTTSKTVTNGGTYGTLPTPTRSSYKFDGWYTKASGGTKVTSSTTVNLTGNQTLYAHWTNPAASYPYNVGDNVWAKIETVNGSKTLLFYSLNGTLSRDWKKIVGFKNIEAISAIGFGSGSDKMYLPKDSSFLFSNYENYDEYRMDNLKKIDTSKMDTSKVTNMQGMFRECHGLAELDLSSFNTKNVTNMAVMFCHCENLTKLNLHINTSNVTIMRWMFAYCRKLTNLDVSSFNTAKVTDMGFMFFACNNLVTLDLKNFNTSNVTDMVDMFMACFELKSVNVSSFNTSKVTGMAYMFDSCSSLTSLDLRSFDTSKVKSFYNVFGNCESLKKLDLSNFNTSNATSMVYTFGGCSSLQELNISSFDLSKVTDAGYIFKDCNNLQILRTPKKNTLRGEGLPITMYSSSGTKYTSLPVLSKSIVLARTQKLAKEHESMSKQFTDVQDPMHPYYKAIYWAADAGITKGYSDGTFGINRSCTRGEMMMFLWRYAGKPNPKTVSKSPFKDVPKTHTFYKAILWGSQKGITKGYSDGTFGVNRNVSRGECMMFLWRLRGKPAPKAVAKAPFPDVPKSHVFYNAVLWGYQKKITTGFTSGPLKGKFGVNENCSRGQIVTFLYRAK